MRVVARSTRTAVVAGVALLAVLGTPGARAGASAPVGAASVGSAAARPSVTLSLASRLRPVTGDTYVVYRDGGAAAATVSGAVTGAPPGSTVGLLLSRFPFTAPARLGARTALHRSGRTATYSFSVRPPIATRYSVELLSRGPDPSVLAMSRRAVVYVAAHFAYSPVTFPACSRPRCHQQFRITATYPPSAASSEATKQWRTYFNVSLSPTQTPPAPIWLTLQHDWRVSRPRPAGPGTYVTTFRFSFAVGQQGYDWTAAACTVDSWSTDGLGLPGQHRCGAHRVMARRFTNGYIG